MIGFDLDPFLELKIHYAPPELSGWRGERCVPEQNVLLSGKSKRGMAAE